MRALIPRAQNLYHGSKIPLKIPKKSNIATGYLKKYLKALWGRNLEHHNIRTRHNPETGPSEIKVN